MNEIRRVLKVAAWRLLVLDLFRTLAVTATAAVGALILLLLAERVFGLAVAFPGDWARAAAGVAGGAVYGASDRIGAYPNANPVTPGDLAATLFHALGLDPAGHFTDGTNRPYKIADGKPVTGLFS